MTSRREYRTWHLHDAGGPVLRLAVRYHGRTEDGRLESEELPDWRDGLDLPAALVAAATEGWREFDREPGNAPGEYAVLHLMREVESRREPTDGHA